MIIKSQVGKTFAGASQNYENWTNECKAFREYLLKNTATATMAAVALHIYRPNACRYKRWLENAGQLWEVREGICAVTGFPAMFSTTDPARAPINPQTSLFVAMEGGCNG